VTRCWCATAAPASAAATAAHARRPLTPERHWPLQGTTRACLSFPVLTLLPPGGRWRRDPPGQPPPTIEPRLQADPLARLPARAATLRRRPGRRRATAGWRRTRSPCAAGAAADPQRWLSGAAARPLAAAGAAAGITAAAADPGRPGWETATPSKAPSASHWDGSCTSSAELTYREPLLGQSPVDLGVRAPMTHGDRAPAVPHAADSASRPVGRRLPAAGGEPPHAQRRAALHRSSEAGRPGAQRAGQKSRVAVRGARLALEESQ
jgi:hypothetical protein